MRHLIFFKELIDENLQYMYFDFTDAQNFPEILYQLPLNELSLESPYRIIGYQYDDPAGRQNNDITLESSHADREDFYPPLNFYRIILNSPNNRYNRIDLKEEGGSIETALTSSISNYLYFLELSRQLKNKLYVEG